VLAPEEPDAATRRHPADPHRAGVAEPDRQPVLCGRLGHGHGGEARLPPPVPESPAILRAFHPAAWGASVDDPEDVIRPAINDRRRANGAAPYDYGDDG